MPPRKGRRVAKPVCEACGRASDPREHVKKRKISQTAPARATTALQTELRLAQEQLADRVAAVAASEEEVALVKAAISLAKTENRLEKERLERCKDSIAKTAAAQEAKEAARVAALVAKHKQKDAARVARSLAQFTTVPPAVSELDLQSQHEKLKHIKGSTCTQAQSRCILLLLIALVKDDNLTQTAAVEKVCSALTASSFLYSRALYLLCCLRCTAFCIAVHLLLLVESCPCAAYTHGCTSTAVHVLMFIC